MADIMKKARTPIDNSDPSKYVPTANPTCKRELMAHREM